MCIRDSIKRKYVSRPVSNGRSVLMQKKNIAFYFLQDLVCFKIFTIGREWNSVCANIVYFNCPLWLHYIIWFLNVHSMDSSWGALSFLSRWLIFIPISWTSTHKCLGVQIDEKLTWECHIYMICKRAGAGVGAMKRIKAFVPIDTLEKI